MNIFIWWPNSLESKCWLLELLSHFAIDCHASHCQCSCHINSSNTLRTMNHRLMSIINLHIKYILLLHLLFTCSKFNFLKIYYNKTNNLSMSMHLHLEAHHTFSRCCMEGNKFFCRYLKFFPILENVFFVL